jgi:hypothetical protein
VRRNAPLLFYAIFIAREYLELIGISNSIGLSRPSNAWLDIPALNPEKIPKILLQGHGGHFPPISRQFSRRSI